MLRDINTLTDDILTSDVVIIGAGTVGLYVAAMLSRKGVSVTVLESGGLGFEQANKQLNSAEIVGRQHDGAYDGRARVIGGTSTLWGGQLTKFSAIDFEARQGFASAPWPIEFDEIVKHYGVVAETLNLDTGMLDDEQIFRKIGADAKPFENLDLIFTRWLIQPNIANVFQGDILDSENLQVIYNATITEASVGSDNSVTSVIATSSSGEKRIRCEGRYFVLAAGTIEISRLLLWFAHRDSGVPWADNPWIGRCFQDHIDVRVGKVVPKNAKVFSNIFENIVVNKRKYQPKLILPQVDVRSEGFVGVACSFIYQSKMSEHLSHLKTLVRSLRSGFKFSKLASLPKHLFGAFSVWFPLAYRYFISNRIYSPYDKGIVVNIHCEQVPLAASSISLSDNEDRFGMKMAKLDWRVEGATEIRSILEFCRRLDASLRQSGIGHVEMDPEIVKSPEKLLDNGRDSFHQCGGARMATSDRDGVVDKNLRVFGTGNLHIAGAAVFPSSSFANPTFTALALGNRLADQIASAIQKR